MFFPSGGVQFCSATYRLFKVGPSELSRDTDTVVEVQYKGGWEGEGEGRDGRMGGRRGGWEGVWMKAEEGEGGRERGEGRVFVRESKCFVFFCVSMYIYM